MKTIKVNVHIVVHGTWTSGPKRFLLQKSHNIGVEVYLSTHESSMYMQFLSVCTHIHTYLHAYMCVCAFVCVCACVYTNYCDFHSPNLLLRCAAQILVKINYFVWEFAKRTCSSHSHTQPHAHTHTNRRTLTCMPCGKHTYLNRVQRII